MSAEHTDYNLLLEFFNAFSSAGIEGIDANNSRILQLDKLLNANRQTFYIADVILLDILFVSKNVQSLFGVKPEEVSLGYFMTTTHPDDINRHHLARAQLINQAQELYINKKGYKIMSTSVRARKPDGNYFDALYQGYYFYSKVPYESVFLILVITDISGFEKMNKHFHIYNGDDSDFFCFPDKELLLMGSIYTLSEFKIIELVEEGLSSKEIAQKLFRSIYTINTHRTNILKKSGHSTIGEVISELKATGLL